MKILSGLVSVVFFYIVFTIVVRIRSRPKRKIKEIFHGHVYWETVDNTTNNTSRNNLNTSRNNLRSISEVNEDITIPTMIPKPNPLPTLYVLTTGVRKFKNPSYFNVKMVYGETFVDSTGTIFDEGFGPKSKWPIGAKLVADGHVTIWQKIMEECSGWCFVAEDDAQFPSTPPPKMPSDGYVSFYREGVCSKATGPYSKDFKRVIHRIVKGICMPYSTVAYALTKTHAASLLSSLPMDKPVDHFLWEQGILNNRAFVSTVWGVKHVPGPSIKNMNKKPVLGPSKNIKKLPSIAIMLTSYNRKGYLETFSKWLASDPSYISGKFDFFVRDDHSSQYGKTELERWFPKASIAIEAVHHRSDQNIRLNFERFVKMDYDLLLSIDSDSILDPSWYSFITENMPKEGFATLYHSSASWHKTHHCRDGVWCHQSSTGSLGMVLSKELIRKMLLENRNSGFDWGIIEWLKKQKIPVRAPKKSLALHYGYYGQNNNPRNMHELADNFDMTSIHKSVRPCINWWLKANNPNDFCPHTSYSKKKLVKTSISDYTKTKMDKWFLRMQSIGTPVPKLMDIKGGSIIDVGANVGVFSNNVRKVCKDCHIFAFEAVPDFAKYIESRKIGKIDVYPFGLSDESASADFWLSKDGNYGWNTMIPNKNGRKNMKKVKLKFKAFDELNIDVGNLKLIKIDTEGAEYKVLGGLRNVIQKYKPVVFVEFGFGKSHPNYREEIDEFDKLIEMGYTCDRDYKKVKGTTDLVFKFQNKENSASEVTISGNTFKYTVPAKINLFSGIVYGILSGGKKAYSRRQSIRNTWCTNKQCLFVIAGLFDDIRDEYETYEDILWLDLPEIYFGEDSVLPYKTQTFMFVVNNIPKLTYAVKTDDDSFIFSSKLSKLLFDKRPDYWGRVHRNASPIRDRSNKWFISSQTYSQTKFPNYCSGAGYALSKAFLSCAVPKLAKFNFMPREDVATGQLAELCGITPMTSGDVNFDGNKRKSTTTIINHYVKTNKEMQSLFNSDNNKRVDSDDWCKTHDVLPNGAFCSKKYAGIDKKLASALLSILGKSIGDFGAGGGWYTDFFNKNSHQSSAYDASPTRGNTVTYMDLTEPSQFEDVYDSVLCLEVGEHIPTEKSDILLSNIVKHAKNNVVLSWAVPGQGGNGHINCQTNKWVIDKMNTLGWTHDDKKSQMLRLAASFNWFKNTIMVFFREYNTPRRDKNTRNKYITTDLIGGLGNIMWLYQSVHGIAKYNNMIPVFDKKSYRYKVLQNMFGVDDQSSDEIKFTQQTTYDDMCYKNGKCDLPKIKESTKIGTYLQSIHFFRPLGKTLKDFYTIKTKHKQDALRLIKNTEACIHVRIFPESHLKLKKNICPTMKMVIDIVMEFANQSKRIKIFSNDLDFVKKHVHTNSWVSFADSDNSKTNKYRDFAALTMCDDLIITCGTFSGQAAALHSGNGNVYYFDDPWFETMYGKEFISHWRPVSKISEY